MESSYTKTRAKPYQVKAGDFSRPHRGNKAGNWPYGSKARVNHRFNRLMLGRNSLPHSTSSLLMTAEFALRGFYRTFLWRTSVQPRYGERCDPNSKSFCTYATVLLAVASTTTTEGLRVYSRATKNTLGFEVVWTVSGKQGGQRVETFQADRAAQQRFRCTSFPILFPKEENAGVSHL